MSPVLTVARRELKALFDTPTGYVLLVVFLVANAFFFFGGAYLTDSASLRPMLELLPRLLLFFAPGVAMRALAEDARTGQLEVLLAQPLTEWQLLLGKYLGVLGFLGIALLLTVPIPLGLALGAELPWGQVVAQYVGSLLLAAAFAAVGVWASGISRSQITAFILGVAVMFLLVLPGLINPLIVGLSPRLGAIADRLGVLAHFGSIGRGVIDLRDAIYFVSLAAIFLTLAYGSLLARKLAVGQAPVRRLRLGVLLLVAALVVVNLLGSHIGGRLDLTPGRAYTLAPTTRRLVAELPDILTIKLFASQELPAEAALMRRDLDDLLADFREAGKGKIRLVTRDPASDAEALKDARTLGITPVQFNTRSESELQVKEGYLGLALQYADAVEPIPFVRRTDDLEYRLAVAIRGLTRATKPVVGLVVAMDGWGVEGRTLDVIQEQLSRSYTVLPLSLGDTTQPADSISTLIIAGQPDTLSPVVEARLAAFLARGGGALVMTTGAPIEGREPRTTGRETAWNRLLAPYGVKVRPDLVYDLASNQIVPVPGENGGAVYQPYPYWVRAQADPASTVTDGVGEVFLPWTSSVQLLPDPRSLIRPLLMTSRLASVVEGDIDLNPRREFPPIDPKPRVLAVSVQPADSGGPRGRLVVVGNMEFATDRYASATPENAIFALNAIDWLAQDEALIAIRSRDRRPPRLLFSSPALQQGVRYANQLGLPLLLAIVGAVHLARRRRRSLTPWAPLTGGGGAA